MEVEQLLSVIRDFRGRIDQWHLPEIEEALAAAAEAKETKRVLDVEIAALRARAHQEQAALAAAWDEVRAAKAAAASEADSLRQAAEAQAQAIKREIAGLEETREARQRSLRDVEEAGLARQASLTADCRRLQAEVRTLEGQLEKLRHHARELAERS
jgi:chromosome segregation ATPase